MGRLKMRLFISLFALTQGYEVDLLPAANGDLQIFALPMGHGEATIIQCPVDAAGNGGEISIFDLGSIVKYYETWDVAKLLTQGQKIRYMFMTHADETHTSFFPKVFPLERHETEKYPDLSDLQAIYHTCPSDHYVWSGPPKNHEIEVEFLAANLNNCERNRFGMIDSDKDSLVARVRYNDFSILLPGDNMKPNQEEVVSFYESIDPGFLKSSVLKLSHHGSSYGTTKELIDAVQPSMVFYSSAHLNQDWSSGECTVMKNLIQHTNEDGKPTIRRYGESVANDIYVQNELNCYDPWAPDLPDDQPVRTIENSQRAAFYSTTFGKKFYNDDKHNTAGKWTWPCNVNRLDLTSNGTLEGTHITPVSQGSMPFPPCMEPDFWSRF